MQGGTPASVKVGRYVRSTNHEVNEARCSPSPIEGRVDAPLLSVTGPIFMNENTVNNAAIFEHTFVALVELPEHLGLAQVLTKLTQYRSCFGLILVHSSQAPHVLFPEV